MKRKRRPTSQQMKEYLEQQKRGENSNWEDFVKRKRKEKNVKKT